MNLKGLILISIGFLQFHTLISQDQNIFDSTLATIKNIENDTIRIRKIINFANNTYLNSPNTAKNFTNEALKQSINANYQLGIADCYNLYGILEGIYGDYKKSENQYYKALEIYKRIENKMGAINVYNNLGLIYSDRGSYIEALNSYIKALKVLETYNNKNLKALIYSNLGKLYLEVKEYEKAKTYLTKSESIYHENGNNKSLLYVYSMLGSISKKDIYLDKAFDYYKRSMNIALKENNKTMIGSLYRNIGEIYFEQKNYDSAIYYYNISLGIFKDLNNSTGILRTLNVLGYFYYYTKDYEKSLKHLHDCNNLSEEKGFKEGLRNSALHLSYVYKALNNYKSAYNWRIYYDNLYYEAYSNETFKSITELFTKLEEERKEYELQLNEQKKKIKSLISYLVVSALLILFAALFLIQKNIAKRAIRKQESLNKELTSKAIFLVRKNEVFSKIENILRENKDNFIKENQGTIQGVLNEVKLAQNEEVWNEFELYFNKVHKNFHEKLNEDFPNLSVNERRLCTLLRMNMTTKDISSITQQTAHTIDIARSRLRKKLGIANKKTSLYTFLTKY